MKPILGSLEQPQLDRRKVLIGILFGSAAALAAWRQPRIHLDYLGTAKLDDVVPKKIGSWNFVAASGLIVPPSDQLERELYSQLLTRVYTDGRNPPVMLLIAQSAGQTGILQVHRPETCYPASGYAISAVLPHDINLGSRSLAANSLTATADGTAEQIIYWTRVGDTVPQDWAHQKLVTAEQNLKGIIPDAVLVRVSTIDPDPAAAHRRLDSFVRAMVASVAVQKRPVFVA